MIEAVFSRASDGRNTLEEIWRLRHRVFKERLGWDLATDGTFERDEFDHADAWYLALRDPRGRIVGTCRLIPTQAAYMLAGPFRALLGDRPPPNSVHVWEGSRLAVDLAPGTARGAALVRSLTAEIYCGIVEFGLSVGMEEILTVYDPFVARFVRHIGCRPNWEGPVNSVGGGRALAASFAITEAALAAIQNRSGIRHSVLESRVSSLSEAAA